jgi:hypothetical protein
MSVSKAPSTADLAQLAADHLVRAHNAVAREAFLEAVVWANLAAEVGIPGVGGGWGFDTQQHHYRGASGARRLHEDDVLPEDLGSLLVRLNDARKLAVYDGREPDLHGRSWPQVLRAIGDIVDVARSETA